MLLVERAEDSFWTSCLVLNSSVFLVIRPFLRTDFSEIGTTVFWFSRGVALFSWGFVSFSSLLFLVCSKCLKSLELRAWILVQIDRCTTEGHTMESWERHSMICLFSSRNQWRPLISLISSQIHVTIFPPMAKLFHTRIKTNITHNSSIRSDEGLTLETSAFQIVHGGNSTLTNTFDKTKFSCFTLSPTQHHSFLRN